MQSRPVPQVRLSEQLELVACHAMVVLYTQVASLVFATCVVHSASSLAHGVTDFVQVQEQARTLSQSNDDFCAYTIMVISIQLYSAINPACCKGILCQRLTTPMTAWGKQQHGQREATTSSALHTVSETLCAEGLAHTGCMKLPLWAQ